MPRKTTAKVPAGVDPDAAHPEESPSEKDETRDRSDHNEPHADQFEELANTRNDGK